MGGESSTIVRRTIVELDLVGYSDIARYLEEHLGANAVMQLNKQIQSFVDEGLLAVNIPRSQAVNSKAGDNAIVVFEQVSAAHRFAEAFHRITEQYNSGKTEVSAERHFRLGISTGDIAIEGNEIAGTTIIDSCRLEAGGDKGHILICSNTLEELSAQERNSYVGPEILKDKRGKEHSVYRYVVVEEDKSVKQIHNAYNWLSVGMLKNRSSFAVAVYASLAAMALAAGIYLTEPLRKTSAVKAVTTEFLNGIKSSDYKNAYNQLTSASRQGYKLSDFIVDHTGISPKIQNYAIAQLTLDKHDNGKAFARISSVSILYGQKKPTLELNKEDGKWRVVLSRNVVVAPLPTAHRAKQKGGGLNSFINSIFN